MTTKLVKWASNDGQITKSKLSDGRRAKFLPSATGFYYDWLRFKRYLGNVGINAVWVSEFLIRGLTELASQAVEQARQFDDFGAGLPRDRIPGTHIEVQGED